MMLYDKEYDDEDYYKMMEETAKMLTQIEYKKKQIEDEFEANLNKKIITGDNSKISVEEYETMKEERNFYLNAILKNIKMLDANIIYLKDFGCKLLLESGVLSEEEFANNKIANLVMETIEDKKRELLQINTIIEEYNELKLNREVDMLVVIQDTSYNKDYEIQELEDTYNDASKELNYIEGALFELDIIKTKLDNDLNILGYILGPKDEDTNKTKKKGK